ncbi:hypothetical protein HHK36_007824 [Tetracentron sinense]|uniref:Protein kinase domain-containing protein n=1 Tax=Tetracentron sinense TaxID=13715 RepID=A0A834ZFB7_TETSI|nr:hypothetical protein HHK36_007824 [Tetracentron sinense]
MVVKLQVVLQIIWLLWLTKASAATPPPSLAKPGCEDRCGNISIPYPFGIGDGCYQNVSFKITCNNLTTPILTTSTSNLEVLEISLSRSTVRVNSPVSTNCNPTDLFIGNLPDSFEVRSMSPRVPVVLNWRIANWTCPVFPSTNYTATCSRTGYCSTNSSSTGTNSSFNYDYGCSCGWGFEGNPYLPNGCQDVDECLDWKPSPCPGMSCRNTYGTFYCYSRNDTAKVVSIGISIGVGLLFILLASLWFYQIVKKKKMIRQKEKFFKQNGGLLLQQQMSSNEGSVNETKIFTARELEKATDNYNENRILGQGGNGTVYKGMLVDGKIVAVKKSKIVDEGQIEQFINEVAILSQINHRNVVKLLGCCLETEVPLLVYEFISNGTLLDYINDPSEEFPVLWRDRLRIATEVAGAIAYLHSATSIPIYHRDIKSTNILLDDKHRAKVADFGISRSVPIDKTHLTTLVQGTFGYLDPEYFRSSQFTEKSDVYSFGVVLVELLTGQKPISSTRSQEEKSLAIYFLSSIKENRLFDILDPRVVKDGRKEELNAVADLAKRCLNLNGKKRPTMKEVAMDLEGVRMYQNNFSVQQNPEEVECCITETSRLWDACSYSTGYEHLISLPLDVQPLLLNPSR